MGIGDWSRVVMEEIFAGREGEDHEEDQEEEDEQEE